MNLQDVWLLLNEILRADPNTEIDKKMLALNQGYLYLAKLMIENGTYLQELVSAPTSIVTTINTNSIPLPDDYLGLLFLWYLSGTTYTPVLDNMIVDYSYLLRQAYSNFLDTTNTGIPSLFAINKPNIFTDLHWPETNADGVKIMYHKKPALLVAYDEVEVDLALGVLNIVGIGPYMSTLSVPGRVGQTIRVFNNSRTVEYLDFYTGLPPIVDGDELIYVTGNGIIPFGFLGFTEGEVILQDTTNASATINSIDYENNKLRLLTSSRSGIFFDSYDITGQTGATIATQSGDMIEKPQELEISDELKLELATAGALQYLFMEDNPEAEVKEKTLKQLIKKNNVISKSNVDYKIRIG